MLRTPEILFKTKYLKIVLFIYESGLVQFLIKPAYLLRLKKLDKTRSDFEDSYNYQLTSRWTIACWR